MNATTNQVSINLITESTDISTLNMDPKNWDVEINGVPYQVVRIKGYVHSIGGRNGLCDLWAYPRGEEPTIKNLVRFNVYNPVSWGIVCKPKNYLCHGDNEARNGSSVIITRNGERFYTCVARGLNAGIDEARMAISKFIKHPLGLNAVDYKEQAKGRLVYYRGVKAVITRFLDEQGCVMIAPFDGLSLALYPFDASIGIAPNKDGEVKVDILDPDIYWFCGPTPIRKLEVPTEIDPFDGIDDAIESDEDKE